MSEIPPEEQSEDEDGLDAEDAEDRVVDDEDEAQDFPLPHDADERLVGQEGEDSFPPKG